MRFKHVIRMAMFLPALFETVNGHYGYGVALCRVLGSLEHVEFIASLNYNKAELLKFNTTENKVVGYTEYARKLADDLNSQPDRLRREGERNIKNCKKYGAKLLSLTETTVKPEVSIRSVRQASGKQPAMLICSAYDFYPKPIKVTWFRDGEVVTSDVTSTEELADGDWYYQIHSHLEYFPKLREKIACVVEHASFTKPMIYHWDPSLDEYERNKIITGAAGLVLGMILTAGGLIYHKRKWPVTASQDQVRSSQPLQTINDTEEQ